MHDDAITATAAARILNLSAVRVRQMLRRGTLPGFKPGRDWLTTRAAVAAYALRRATKPAAPAE